MAMEIAAKAFFVMFLVLINGFFVAAEFALVKVRRARLEASAADGSQLARMALHVTHNLDSYLSGCQLGITLASLGLGWIGEPLVAKTLEPLFEHLGVAEQHMHVISFVIAFSIITFLHISIGEQVPKMMAIVKDQSVAQYCAPPLILFYKIFKPFIWVLNTSSNIMLRAIGINTSEAHDEMTEEEVRLLLAEAASGGHLSDTEQVMMENILDLEDKIVRPYIVPRNQIVFLDSTRPVTENLQIAADSGHSRLPLCDGDLDHIHGIVHTKDLFAALATNQSPDRLADLARPVMFVPESTRLDRLLQRFQRDHGHLALVVSEYGDISGMITLENVLEQVVGPIQDEFDNEQPLLRKVGGGFIADGACRLSELAEKAGLDVPPDTEVDTIGGLLMELLGHLPTVNETVDCGEHRLTALAVETTRVISVRIDLIAIKG